MTILNSTATILLVYLILIIYSQLFNKLAEKEETLGQLSKKIYLLKEVPLLTKNS